MSSSGITNDLDKIARNIPRYSAYFRAFFHHFTEKDDVDIRRRFYYEMIHLPDISRSFVPKSWCSRCKLYIVDDDGRRINWIESKPSNLPNAGTGVFPSKSFRKDELITIYLGRPYNKDESDTYAFEDVTAADEQGNTDIPYLLAQFINQAVMSNPNCMFDGYKIIALRNIRQGEELLIYYNRDVFCGLCGTLMDKSEGNFFDRGMTCSHENCHNNSLFALCHDNKCAYRLSKIHYCIAMIA